ncbi:hypothetical protein Ciccas_003086 [Cichlidogyrus casuarinus]|uniref:Uncharacterized protein n=1 Tax=Cichlidogyrus casuarinus TaxID=1844966 RepID=A0ABD2QFT9_9PLAT
MDNSSSQMKRMASLTRTRQGVKSCSRSKKTSTGNGRVSPQNTHSGISEINSEIVSETPEIVAQNWINNKEGDHQSTLPATRKTYKLEEEELLKTVITFLVEKSDCERFRKPFVEAMEMQKVVKSRQNKQFNLFKDRRVHALCTKYSCNLWLGDRKSTSDLAQNIGLVKFSVRIMAKSRVAILQFIKQLSLTFPVLFRNSRILHIC